MALPVAIGTSPVRPPRPGLGAPTFIGGVEALRTDCVVTDEVQREGGGRADDGGWQLKASEPERQRRCNLGRIIPVGTAHPVSIY